MKEIGSPEKLVMNLFEIRDANFIIARGDGTVNNFVNSLMEVFNKTKLKIKAA